MTPLLRAAARGSVPIWLLTGALLAAALALYLGPVQGLAMPAAPISAPWWLLAGGFLVAEVAVVHYDFRREAHSFSLAEVPLVFGLFFAPGADVVTAQVCGAAAALLLHRRQTGVKLWFNLADFALSASVAVLVFRAVAGDGGAFDPAGWAGALLAAVVSSGLSTAAIFTAISLSERRADARKLPEQLSLAMLATVGSASLGLVGVGAAWHDPAATWLLAVPVGMFYLAYRAYVVQRQEHDSMEFLYRSARILDEAPDVASGVGLMLRHACLALRAELAQFALLSDQAGQLALVVTATADTARSAQRVRVEQIDGVLHRALQSRQPQLLALTPPLPGPDGHALTQVMISPLRSESQTLGALLVGNRLGTVGSFKATELRLFHTLVAQLAASLERGRLARMLAEATQRAERERDKGLVLQRGLRPPRLPAVPGTSVAVRYVPGEAGAEVGGDWYDVVRLPDGDVAAAIGDVLGHDLRAAVRMGQARSALRAYAAEGHAPAAVMERLNRLLVQTDAEFMGTCCYLQLSARHDTVTVVLAGHPPPLLIDPAGRSALVDVETNLPLGVEENATFTAATLRVMPGSTLVLYTDGLVESRTLPLQVGLDRMARIPRQTAVGDLETLADRLLDNAPTDRVADDVTLLLLRNELVAVGLG